MPEASKAPLVRAVFDSVAERYDLMNDLMSAGIHRWWKDEMVAWLNPRPGQRLLDVAGGTGDVACRALSRMRPIANGPAAAQSCRLRREPAMLEIGRARAIDDGILDGIEWLCGDAEALPFADRSFDLYTIAFGLRNVTRIERALAEARRVLQPGGRFLCLEFTPAVAPVLQPLYDLYSFAFLPLLGQIGDRQPRRLRLSGREHPAVSAAERGQRDDRGRGSRTAAIPQSDRRHRRASFGLAALRPRRGLRGRVRSDPRLPQSRPPRPDRR